METHICRTRPRGKSYQRLRYLDIGPEFAATVTTKGKLSIWRSRIVASRTYEGLAVERWERVTDSADLETVYRAVHKFYSPDHFAHVPAIASAFFG